MFKRFIRWLTVFDFPEEDRRKATASCWALAGALIWLASFIILSELTSPEFVLIVYFAVLVSGAAWEAFKSRDRKVALILQLLPIITAITLVAAGVSVVRYLDLNEGHILMTLSFAGYFVMLVLIWLGKKLDEEKGREKEPSDIDANYSETAISKKKELPRKGNEYKYVTMIEHVPQLVEWFKERGGILVWPVVDPLNPDNTCAKPTPAKTEVGEPCGKPQGAIGEPILITNPAEVGVEFEAVVTWIPVKIARIEQNGQKIILTDASRRKVEAKIKKLRKTYGKEIYAVPDNLSRSALVVMCHSMAGSLTKFMTQTFDGPEALSQPPRPLWQ
jgi:hypothetical protein